MADGKDNHPLAVMASVENLSGLYIVSRHYNPLSLKVYNPYRLSQALFQGFCLIYLNTLQIDPQF